MSTDADGDAGRHPTADAGPESDAADDRASNSTGEASDPDEGLGRRGWVLVAAVVVAVLVVPLTIYLWPAAGGVLGAHYRGAMLVLPLFPAVLLGVVAVWSMTVGRDPRR